MQKFQLLIFIILVGLFHVTNIHSQLFISADAGYSYRLMLTPDSVTSSYATYFNKKRPGINLNGEIVYYNENQGLGFGFNSFLNRVSAKQVEILKGVKLDKSENIHINYYSIQYHRRKNFNKSNFSSGFCFGMGYVQYLNTGKEAAEEIDLDGKTYGLNVALSFEYKIFKHLSIHITPNFFMAVMTKYLMNGYTVTLKNKESLTKFDVNSGLSVIF